jgi:hypothetical protein
MNKLLHRIEEAGGKIFSNLQSNIGAIISKSATMVRDNSLAQSWRKK